jgi:hypothetical protein
VVRDSVVFVATRRGRKVRGSKPGGGNILPLPFLTAPPPKAHPASGAMGAGSLPRGQSVDHPPPSSVEIKERLEVHFCYPFGPL